MSGITVAPAPSILPARIAIIKSIPGLFGGDGDDPQVSHPPAACLPAGWWGGGGKLYINPKLDVCKGNPRNYDSKLFNNNISRW